MQIQISWPLQKPTGLDLHCLLIQGMKCSAREGLILKSHRPWVKVKNFHTNVSTFNLMPPQSLILLAAIVSEQVSRQLIGLVVLEKIFKGFYHIWACMEATLVI